MAFPQARDQLRAATEYNAKLAASGQPVLGEAVDPFDIANGSSQASSQSDSKASKDAEYQSLLDTGNGVMGAVEIPKIDVDLPIYHGTGEDQLAMGVGHLYGTSLPVAGRARTPSSPAIADWSGRPCSRGSTRW